MKDGPDDMKPGSNQWAKEAERWAMAAWGCAATGCAVGCIKHAAGWWFAGFCSWFMLALMSRIASGDCD